MSILEEALLRDASTTDASRELPTTEFGERFLEATRTAYNAAHRSQIKQLKKSRAITAYIRLLSSEHVYPDALLLDERLALCITILSDSAQRPVLEEVGLTLLKIDFAHQWTQRSPDLLAQVVAVSRKQPRANTIPLLALCMDHDRAHIDTVTAAIAGAKLQSKKTRVGELVETLEIYPDSRSLQTFLTYSCDAILSHTTPAEKAELLRRAIRECVDKEMFLHHERWTLLIDPIISQNLTSNAAAEMLSDLVETLPTHHARRYLIDYTRSMAQSRRMFSSSVLRLIEHVGTSQLIPYLYPSTQHVQEGARRNNARKSPYATEVARIIEVIIEREQLDRNAGGLSLATGSAAGGLTAIAVSHGTLSIDAERTTAMTSAEPVHLLPPIYSHEPSDAPSQLVTPHFTRPKLTQVELVVVVLLMGIVLLVLYLLGAGSTA